MERRGFFKKLFGGAVAAAAGTIGGKQLAEEDTKQKKSLTWRVELLHVGGMPLKLRSDVTDNSCGLCGADGGWHHSDCGLSK